MNGYKSSLNFDRAPAEALVFQCSDHRTGAALRDFLDNGLSLKGNYDLLAMPGGPQCMTLVEYLPKLSWALSKWIRYLVDTHELKRLILIAHEDCGWYKQLPFHLLGSSDPRHRQEDDLRRVKQVLARDFPHLRVELYYAAFDSSDHVTVETVPG